MEPKKFLDEYYRLKHARDEAAKAFKDFVSVHLDANDPDHVSVVTAIRYLKKLLEEAEA